MFDPKDYEINEQNYRLTYQGVKLLLKLSPLKVFMHDLTEEKCRGEIFLFNHFTRFETFIPQYVLYDKAKVFCRSVADHKLFKDDLLADYLRSVGAIPNNLHNVMDFMVDEMNLGRKLVIFPEGAMIKDRKVRDKEGRLAIYKREGGFRRKPHTGAAVMAFKCQITRELYRLARKKGDSEMVEHYAKNFPAIKDPDELDRFAAKDVEIIPANITFYPMRRDENILEKYVKRFSGITSKRVLEELKMESNILLKQTDMDVRFGKPIRIVDHQDKGYWSIINSRYLLDRAKVRGGGWLKRMGTEAAGKKFDYITAGWFKKRTETIRDEYMNAIYDLTTINLDHLTAHTLFDLNNKAPQGTFEISYLRSLLFMSICDLRNVYELHLHQDIRKRAYVNSVLLGEDLHITKILERFQKAGLLKINDNLTFTVQKKLVEEFPFDSIRVENPAEVLDNEAQSVPKAVESLDRLYREEGHLVDEKVSLLLHRRAQKIYEHEVEEYQSEAYKEVNKNEERTTTGEPFFYRTGKKREERVGVVLIHGFSASPAEMKLLGEELFEKGYEVFGVRLPGHGTSPADLKERSRKEWLREVKLSISLMKHHAPKVFVVGNSMGALLSMMAVGQYATDIDGFVAIAPAFKIKDKRIALVTYVDAAQKFYQLFADLKTEWPYQTGRPENPDINYSLLPYHGLFELYQTTKEAAEHIEGLAMPTLFIQADKEYTVDPEATYEAFEKVPAKDKTLLKVDVDKHVITLDKGLPTFKAITDFLERLK